jgi:O-antigen/teichoic acid export membrane protein
MFRFGRHPYLTGYLLLIGQQAERLILLQLPAGIELIGLYTPAIVCSTFLQVVPGAFHNVSYPQLVEAYGRNRSVSQLVATITLRIKRVMLIMLPVSLVAGGGIAMLVLLFLPKYSSGLPAALIVCAAGPFYPLRMCTNYYAALHRWREYYIYTVLQAALPFLFIGLLLLVFSPLEAAAAGYVLSVGISAMVLLCLTIRHSRTHTGKAAKSDHD